MNEIPPRRIDVHHHLIPPVFASAMRERGLTQVAGAPLPEWTPERSLQVMDAHGIRTALLSLSSPGTYFGDRAHAVQLSRRCNDYAAELPMRHPGRFGFFAVLPMPFTEDACHEAVRALDQLHADGVVLMGSSEGVFLGDARLDELMAELNRRSATVFVHPNLHASSLTLGLDIPGFLVEFLCDTTRAALNLALSGTMERYPDIRWILAHSGGFLPYVAWRVSLANSLPAFRERAPQGVMHYLRQFWFDTALSPSRFSMAALRELVDPSRILFGSDFPFAPAALTAVQVKELDDNPILEDVARQGIARDNALSLFPRLAEASDSLLPLPAPRREGVVARSRRMVNARLVAMAQRMISR